MSHRVLACLLAVVAASAPQIARADHLSAFAMLDRAASFSTDRIVLAVTGHYVCTGFVLDNPTADVASLQIEVRQPAGRAITTGSGVFEPMLCDGTLQPFSAFVVADQRPWHGGPSHVFVRIVIQDCDPSFNCEFFQTFSDATIQANGGNP